MSDRGYGSVLALALLFGGVLLIGLAVDVARLAAVWQEASHAAQTSAEVGAGWVDPDALYRGRLEIDRTAARVATVAFLDGIGAEGDVTLEEGRVCVTVRAVVRPGLIRLVGARDQGVVVTACAAPRQG